MPKKRTSRKKHSESHETSSETGSHTIEDAILRNLVELQKVNTDLAEKFDKLGKEISSLLSLFEMTAKTFAKNAPLGEYEKDKEFLNKIDKLLDQNKVLAKGLTLMEERLRERVYGQPAQVQPLQPSIGENEESYEPSMSSTGRRPLPKF